MRDVVEHIICTKEKEIGIISDSVIRTEGALERLDLRINGTLEKMAVHVEDSTYWRRFIVGVAISLVISILGFAATSWAISYNLGQYAEKIISVTKQSEENEIDLRKHLEKMSDFLSGEKTYASKS
jgi:hypothetical protein